MVAARTRGANETLAGQTRLTFLVLLSRARAHSRWFASPASPALKARTAPRPRFAFVKGAPREVVKNLTPNVLNGLHSNT